MAQTRSAANWRNMHSCGSHAFTHTYTLTSINTVTTTCKEPAQLLQNLESNFILKVPERSKPEYPEKPPTACPLIANHQSQLCLSRPGSRMKEESVSHIWGEKPVSRTGVEPSPSNIGDITYKLAWPRARLTHWATDHTHTQANTTNARKHKHLM